MFLKVLIISILFIAVTMAGLGIRMLLRPGGRFPETHVSRSAEMRKRGITCAQLTDTGCQSTEGYPGCATCSGKGL
jgi:hypothetical protein